MRITKQIAQDVASKMLVDKYKSIAELDKELGLRVQDYLTAKIPAEVNTVFAKHPDYFDSRRSYYLYGEGLNCKSVTIPQSLPSVGSSFTVKPEQAKEIVKLSNKRDDLHEAYKKALREVEVLLYNLRTYANVTKSFPEALPFLPVGQNTAVALNIEDVRKLLK